MVACAKRVPRAAVGMGLDVISKGYVRQTVFFAIPRRREAAKHRGNVNMMQDITEHCSESTDLIGGTLRSVTVPVTNTLTWIGFYGCILYTLSPRCSLT